MRIVLLGVRGSTSAPGPDHVRYGGSTSCVAVLADGDAVPHLVLDAGTGVRDLDGLLDGTPFAGAVVLTHLHWDHVHGLPFSPSLDSAGSCVDLWLPGQNPEDDADASHLLARVMSPPFFPVGPEGLLGNWEFHLSSTGRVDVAGRAQVRLAPVRHKGGTTFAVRVDLDGTACGYVPDHLLTTTGPSRADADESAARELLHGVDLLLHDGQFTAAEAGRAEAYGHSTVEAALAFADRCDVGRLVLTHHAPTRTDDALDALAARFTGTPGGRPVAFARQGAVLDVAPAPVRG